MKKKKERVEWTHQQEEKLYDLFFIHKCSWSLIAKQLPPFSGTQIKNKLYSTMRRGLKKINSYLKNIKRKQIINMKQSINIKPIEDITINKLMAMIDKNFKDKFDVKESLVEKTRELATSVIKILIFLHFQEDEEKSESASLSLSDPQEEAIKKIKEFNSICRKKRSTVEKAIRMEMQIKKKMIIEKMKQQNVRSQEADDEEDPQKEDSIIEQKEKLDGDNMYASSLSVQLEINRRFSVKEIKPHNFHEAFQRSIFKENGTNEKFFEKLHCDFQEQHNLPFRDGQFGKQFLEQEAKKSTKLKGSSSQSNFFSSSSSNQNSWKNLFHNKDSPALFKSSLIYESENNQPFIMQPIPEEQNPTFLNTIKVINSANLTKVIGVASESEKEKPEQQELKRSKSSKINLQDYLQDQKPQ